MRFKGSNFYLPFCMQIHDALHYGLCHAAIDGNTGLSVERLPFYPHPYIYTKMANNSTVKTIFDGKELNRLA